MNITLLAVGSKMPAWIDAGVHEYAKRLGREWKFSLKEIKPEKRGGISAAQGIAAEETRIRATLPAGSFLVVLDERGRHFTSQAFAAQFDQWQHNGANPCFVIGGADGIGASLKKEAGLMMRLSDMTLPHGLARLLLTEQIYRAASILNAHPYHRE